jgi:hypothetical protein
MQSEVAAFLPCSRSTWPINARTSAKVLPHCGHTSRPELVAPPPPVGAWRMSGGGRRCAAACSGWLLAHPRPRRHRTSGGAGRRRVVRLHVRDERGDVAEAGAAVRARLAATHGRGGRSRFGGGCGSRLGGRRSLGGGGLTGRRGACQHQRRVGERVSAETGCLKARAFPPTCCVGRGGGCGGSLEPALNEAAGSSTVPSGACRRGGAKVIVLEPMLQAHLRWATVDRSGERLHPVPQQCWRVLGVRASPPAAATQLHSLSLPVAPLTTPLPRACAP